MLTQDVIKKKVYKDRDQVLQQSMMEQAQDLNQSKTSRRPRMSEIPLSYQESVGKRGVGVLVDECRRTIEEHNYHRSQSPYKSAMGGDTDYDDGTSQQQYTSVSARNIEIVNAPQSHQDANGYLYVPGQGADAGGLLAHLNKNRENARMESQQFAQGNSRPVQSAKKGKKGAAKKASN